MPDDERFVALPSRDELLRMYREWTRTNDPVLYDLVIPGCEPCVFCRMYWDRWPAWRRATVRRLTREALEGVSRAE